MHLATLKVAIRLRRRKRTQAVHFPVSLHFLMRTAKFDVQLCISTQELHFLKQQTVRKSMFCEAQIALLWLLLAAFLEKCFFLHWNCKTKQCKNQNGFHGNLDHLGTTVSHSPPLKPRLRESLGPHTARPLAQAAELRLERRMRP